MNEIIKEAPQRAKIVLPNRWGSTNQEKELVTITGSLTSPIQLKAKDYAFIKLKDQSSDLLVIFKLKKKPPVPKGSLVSLTGNYSHRKKSFTCLAYQLLNKKLRRECFGCGDKFTTTEQLAYDYCSNCAINGNRYIFRFTKNHCPECGDNSGLIKFSNQPPRTCKLCQLPKAQIIHHG